jgi:hypothetical protein
VSEFLSETDPSVEAASDPTREVGGLEERPDNVCSPEPGSLFPSDVCSPEPCSFFPPNDDSSPELGSFFCRGLLMDAVRLLVRRAITLPESARGGVPLITMAFLPVQNNKMRISFLLPMPKQQKIVERSENTSNNTNMAELYVKSANTIPLQKKNTFQKQHADFFSLKPCCKRTHAPQNSSRSEHKRTSKLLAQLPRRLANGHHQFRDHEQEKGQKQHKHYQEHHSLHNDCPI